MDVNARTHIVTDGQTGAARLSIAGFQMTAADRVAALVARIRYPSSRIEHHYPRWNCITGWLSAAQGVRLFDLARKIDAPGDVVEIGSAFGRSTVCLALGTRAGGRGRVFAVDPHSGGIGLVHEHGDLTKTFSSLEPFTRNIARFGLEDIVVPITLKSRDAGAAWPHAPIRLLFIDGWHSYEACSEDILLWGKWVSAGGAIIIHDHDWEDVRRAVDDCLPKLDGFGEIVTDDPNMAIAHRSAP